ncbi:formate/nitrite transporter family protein [Sphingomonas oligophenolica]|uniref:Formate/nitrite transporter family protein n=1 Tax=Sphingomonas oligophenolica TaxID=301154 RepID=A0A502CGR0_9SPHN|nr:formate/nitrite transporter family protein [Sphingomonas oligophenolica]TPG12347.1 formate/nitrite transporter family protein [Sphingomonas oligophenolica]
MAETEHDRDQADGGASGDDANEEKDVAPGAPSAVALHRTVRKAGEDELDRPFWALTWSGIAAGIAINTSLVAEGMLHSKLPDAPWREAVVALGYPIGFLLVILGRLQLFTESTVTAMLPLATTPSRWALTRTLRLWAIVIGANLIGTAIAGAGTSYGLIVDPALKQGMIDVAMQVSELGFGQTVINAVPAGFLIAMIAWVLPNARTQSFWVIFLITYIVALGGFSHSIVGSDEAFLLMFDGHVSVGTALGGIILPALIGNLIGGAGLFALLAHAQVRSDVQDGDGGKDAGDDVKDRSR